MRRLMLAAALLGAVPTVVVNDRPLHVPSVVDGARVLVPMRPIFEALGAGVVYRDGTIVAKRGERRVTLRIGDRVADVEGVREQLDVAPRIIGTLTYVPLRFVSSALGADVYYDASSQLVTVDLHDAVINRGTVTRPQAIASIPAGELVPVPNSRVASAYPSIGAQLSGSDTVRNLRMTLDGSDVTSYVSVAGGSFLYIPQNGLAVGRHTVVASGYNGATPFEQQWQFDTTLPPAPSDMYNGPNGTGVYSGYQPLPLASQLQLFVDGTEFGPGSWINIHLTGPPNGRAYAFACTGSWRYDMYSSPGSPFYTASIQVPSDLSVTRCPIIAMFIDQYGNVSYAPYPAFISIYGPTPAPTPTPAPVNHRRPPDIRRSPLPLPLGTPTPTPVPGPLVRPSARPIPRPSPTAVSPWRPVITHTPTPMPLATALPQPTTIVHTPVPIVHTPPPHTPIPRRTPTAESSPKA